MTDQLVEVLRQGGLVAVALILFIVWRNERAERIAAQLDANQQREKRIESSAEQAKALAQLGEGSRTESRALRRLIRTQFSSLVDDDEDSDR